MEAVIAPFARVRRDSFPPDVMYMIAPTIRKMIAKITMKNFIWSKTEVRSSAGVFHLSGFWYGCAGGAAETAGTDTEKLKNETPKMRRRKAERRVSMFILVPRN